MLFADMKKQKAEEQASQAGGKIGGRVCVE